MIIFSILIFVGVLLFLFKLKIRRVFGLNVWFDIALTAMLTMVFAGTFSGALIGLLVGAFLSAFLLIGRWFTPYEKPRITRSGVAWETVTPPIPRAYQRFRNHFRRTPTANTH